MLPKLLYLFKYCNILSLRKGKELLLIDPISCVPGYHNKYILFRLLFDEIQFDYLYIAD